MKRHSEVTFISPSLSLSLPTHALSKGHLKTYQEGGYLQEPDREPFTRNQVLLLLFQEL